MDVENKYELTSEQFKLWTDFCLEAHEEMYENKDAYMNVWDRDKNLFIVYVGRSEQSGQENFLTKLLA
tara:strand:+ start:243 stop:446 length:204 start_codon:yes stop_codon:yes gene_type:complete